MQACAVCSHNARAPHQSKRRYLSIFNNAFSRLKESYDETVKQNQELESQVLKMVRIILARRHWPLYSVADVREQN